MGKGGDDPSQDEPQTSKYDSDDDDEIDEGEDQAARQERQRTFAELKTKSPEEVKTHACQAAAFEVRDAEARADCWLAPHCAHLSRRLPSWAARACRPSVELPCSSRARNFVPCRARERGLNLLNQFAESIGCR